MSHQTIVRVISTNQRKETQTDFVSAEHLRKALEDLDCQLERVGQDWRATFNGHSIDFQMLDGRYRAITREGGVDQFNAAWMGRLVQRYAFQVAKEQLGSQGFEVVEEVVGPQKELRLTLRRTL